MAPGQRTPWRTIALRVFPEDAHEPSDLRQRAGDDRQHAAHGREATRYRPVRAVCQAREPEPRRLDQGSDRPVSHPGRRARRRAATGRHADRSDGGQHGTWARAGGGAEGLSPAAVHPRQDESGEDLSPQGHGRRGGDDALGRQQGAPRVLPRRRRAPGAARFPTPTS